MRRVSPARAFRAPKVVTAVRSGDALHSPASRISPRLEAGRIYSLAGVARVFALPAGSRWLLYGEGSLPAAGDKHAYEVDTGGRILSGGNPTGLTVSDLTFTGWVRFDVSWS